MTIHEKAGLLVVATLAHWAGPGAVFALETRWRDEGGSHYLRVLGKVSVLGHSR